MFEVWDLINSNQQSAISHQQLLESLRMTGRGRFLRENAFLVAAVALPLVVVGFFLAASAIPRWLVPPPAYDLLLRTTGPVDQTRPRVAVDFAVRDGRIEATVRGLPANGYPQVPKLFLVDHQTVNVREIPVDLPVNLAETDPPVTVPVSALAGRRVIAEARAPDGYEFQERGYRSTGLVGGLFGMGSHGEKISLVNRGRVVPISFPSNEYGYSVSFVGWVLNEGSR